MISTSNRYLAFLGLSRDGITKYPTDVGIYRVTNVKPSGLPTDAGFYGILFIFGSGYYTHLYVDMHSNAWIAWSEEPGNGITQPPTTWHKLGMNLRSGAGTVYVNANAYVDVDVTFSTPYAEAPVVVPTGGHAGKYDNSGVMLLSTTTTGFKLRVYNKSTGAAELFYRWIAAPDNP